MNLLVSIYTLVCVGVRHITLVTSIQLLRTQIVLTRAHVSSTDDPNTWFSHRWVVAWLLWPHTWDTRWLSWSLSWASSGADRLDQGGPGVHRWTDTCQGGLTSASMDRPFQAGLQGWGCDCVQANHHLLDSSVHHNCYDNHGLHDEKQGRKEQNSEPCPDGKSIIFLKWKKCVAGTSVSSCYSANHTELWRHADKYTFDTNILWFITLAWLPFEFQDFIFDKLINKNMWHSNLIFTIAAQLTYLSCSIWLKSFLCNILLIYLSPHCLL